MSFHQQSTAIIAKIQTLKASSSLPEQQIASRVHVLRSSQLIGTQSSPKIVMTLANTMIGSAIIVYPVLFIKDGMIGSSIIMLMVGCLQFLTCRLLVVHNRVNELQFNESIKRIGGLKVDKLNSIVNMLILFFVAVAYFLLITTNFYQVSGAVIKQVFKINELPSSDSITFKSYSFQWASISCALLCIITVFKTNIDPILKLMKYSIYCVGSYFVFVFVSLIMRIAQGSIVFSQYQMFDSDFSNVAGAFALSFMIHPTAAPILKKSINLKNNERDLLFGYILTAVIYFFVGFVGGLTCAPSVNDILAGKNYNTIFDCFEHTSTTQQVIFYWIGKVVQTGILFQNFSVLPILFFLTRKEFITLVNKPHLEKQLFLFFTVFFLLFSTLVGVLAIDVSAILSFDGAVVGFFMAYGIPIYIHLKCLFKKFTPQQNKIRKQYLTESSTDQSLLQGYDDIDEQIESEILACNQHKAKNKKLTFAIYGTMLVMGVALGVFKLYSFFT